MSQALKIAPFISKLYNLCSGDERYEKSCVWSESGTSFIIVDYKTFTEEALIKVFNNPNYNTFARQLNFYGFCKLNRSYIRSTGNSNFQKVRDNEPKEYYNPLFTRAGDLLAQIKRKPASKIVTSPSRLIDDDNFDEGEDDGSTSDCFSGDDYYRSLLRRNNALAKAAETLKLELEYYKRRCLCLENKLSPHLRFSSLGIGDSPVATQNVSSSHSQGLSQTFPHAASATEEALAKEPIEIAYVSVLEKRN